MIEIAPAGALPRSFVHVPVPYPVSGTRYDAVVPAYTSFIKGSITDQVFGYDRVLEKLSPLKGKRVLDYGCGPGVFAQQMARKGARVTGVDISTESIAQANRSFPPARFPELHFEPIVSGDISHLKGNFDAAVVNFVFCTLPNREEIVNILKNLRAAMRPGGQLVILESNWGKSNGREFQSFALPEVNPLVSGGEVIPVLKGEQGNVALRLLEYYWSPDDMRLMLKEAGFEPKDLEEPTADAKDDRPWIDERTHPPTVIYTAIAKGSSPRKADPAQSDFTDSSGGARALIDLG